MDVHAILAAIRGVRVLILGDICLDRWCTYDPSIAEPSRETGISRIAVTRTETTPGAGGTVASNARALGAERVAVLGALGDDGFGWELERSLAARGIDPGLCVRSSEVNTFTYTKLINTESGHEDVPRVDFVNVAPLPQSVEREILKRLDDALPQFDVVLVSDQAETASGGLVTAAVRERLSQAPEKLVWVDSRLRAEHFRNVIVKGNRDEMEAASARAGIQLRDLRASRGWPVLMMTDGPGGVVVIEPSGETRVPTRPVGNPVDICGAGDSFSAGAALALHVTGSAVEAAAVGNLVASITIMKKGTGTASPEEVAAAAQ